MQSLSQKEYSNLKELYESIYTPKEELTEEILDEVFNELVDELIEEGYEEEEAIDIIESATDEYIEEAKVTFGHDTTPTRASGAPIGARRRYGMRKVGQAVKAAKGAARGAYKTAKAKAASAAVDVSLAGSMAKKKAGEVKQAVKDAPDKAKAAVSAAASDAKKKAKSGIKGFIKRQAQKVVNRMSEEVEALKATGKFSEKEIEAFMEADSLAAMQARREKRLAAQRKREGTTVTGRDFGHDYSLTPAQQKARRDAEFKAGIGTKKEEVEVDEAMSSYDRNRKRAAQRAAERNAARAAGKTGVVPGVGYVSPRKERETYVDSAGTTRHKSGAKMEQVEEEAAMSPQEVALQKKKAMIDKMIASKRMQGLKSAKKSEAPTKAMGEGKELSIDQQMKISRDAAKNRKPYQPGDRQKQRAAQIKQMAKNATKDTRTDAQKMTDATGPRPGSRYRGD